MYREPSRLKPKVVACLWLACDWFAAGLRLGEAYFAVEGAGSASVEEEHDGDDEEGEGVFGA